MHLKAGRHGGIFHFLPEEFAKAITKTGMLACPFASTAGNKISGLHYAFADYIVAEMMVGSTFDDPAGPLKQMMDMMLNLVMQFHYHSENFIANKLNEWGFEAFPAAPASPENRLSRRETSFSGRGELTDASQQNLKSDSAELAGEKQQDYLLITGRASTNLGSASV